MYFRRGEVMKINKINFCAVTFVAMSFFSCVAAINNKEEAEDIIAVTEEQDKNLAMPNIESMESSQNVLCAADPAKEEQMADVLGVQAEGDDSDV